LVQRDAELQRTHLQLAAQLRQSCSLLGQLAEREAPIT
jgi:hypothetical protein